MSEILLVQEFDETPPKDGSGESKTCTEYLVVIEADHKIGGNLSKKNESPSSCSIRVQENFAENPVNESPSTSGLSQSHMQRYARNLSSFARSLRNVFLPVGYPDTVRPGYWHYQVYDSIQGLCSYLRGVVSSAHVLQAAGVGNQNATAWGAAVTWALKDGMGLLGGLVFSSWAAPLFDAYVKEFRFFADLINNMGLFLDMLSPIIPPSMFLWIAAASTLCKTMCGMSAGATKGSITQHFAIAGNLADLHAKEGTQETLVSLIGMTFGVALARYFSRLEATVAEHDEQRYSAWTIQWIVFGALTALHVWSNYHAIQGLRLLTLNRQRAEHVLRNLAQQLAQNAEHQNSKTTIPDGQSHEQNLHVVSALDALPQPDDVQESLAASTYHMLLPTLWSDVQLGARLVEVLSIGNAKEILEEFRNESYVLNITQQGQTLISLLTKADIRTELRAFLHALVIRQMIQNKRQSSSPSALLEELSDAGRLALVQKSHVWVRFAFGLPTTLEKETDGMNKNPVQCSDLWEVLEAKGWDIHSRLYLGYPQRRSQWSVRKID